MSESYANAVMKAMQGEPVVLVAAGVAVMNPAGEILLLQRHDGEWDLPGGHMEVGESLEKTATRELFEETRLTVDTLELLGIASGEGTFYPKRNAYYVTTVYRTTTRSKTLKLSREHLDGKFFALDALPDALSVTARWVAAKLDPISTAEG